MTVNEVAEFLGCSSEMAKTMIADGLRLPVSGTLVKLAANGNADHTDITEEHLDAFIKQFEAEEPGRHPPTKVRRELLTDARHRCVICRESHPLQYHHMVEWAKLPHHDPRHMIAICGSCHTKCTKGMIDHKSQVMYKAKLLTPETNNDPHAAEKRNADKEVITWLIKNFPLSLFEWYFSRGLIERIELIVDDYIAPVWKTFHSPMFHLHDKELWKLYAAVFDCYGAAHAIAPELFHAAGSTTAKLMLNDMSDSEDWAKHRKFRQHVHEGRNALQMLNAYLNDAYFDLKVNELDIRGSGEFVKWRDKANEDDEE
ncbi:hypothetical protein R5W24_002207 [Gemmata sp. JC717]|uniref:HNH endonuclease n=1 Tax=Gemmata algarum TaxID=2975278 RepID=UPI0021BB5A27|nr:hypothetical protein [Gemmata algarum]MDY3553115.1 hypothetical protein [Gemmata algarum]